MRLRNKRLFFHWQPLTEVFEVCFQNSIQTMCADTPEEKAEWCELKPLENKISFDWPLKVKSDTFDNPLIQKVLKTSHSPQLSVHMSYVKNCQNQNFILQKVWNINLFLHQSKQCGHFSILFSFNYLSPTFIPDSMSKVFQIFLIFFKWK